MEITITVGDFKVEYSGCGSHEMDIIWTVLDKYSKRKTIDQLKAAIEMLEMES